MIKTDNRHYNRKSNRDLDIEMRLWIAFTDNGKQELIIGKATDGKSEYTMTYNLEKKFCRQIQIIGDDGKYKIDTDTIQQAKRLLKNWNGKAKWNK